MTAELDLARAIADAVDAKAAGMRPESSTMPATYQGRDAEGKGWVLLPGATEPTPVSRMAVEADLGDTVSVTVANGKATVDSNVSNPSAGVAGVKVVERTANTANATANEALVSAADARSAAISAQSSADTARQAATEATADAATARVMADGASASAAIAKESADKATYSLTEIEDVVGTVNWITEHGEYVLTSDTAIVDGKPYYTRSGTAPDYVYTLVTEPSASELSTYYELELDESVQNYLASHIYLLNDGLYVTTDSATGYKVRIDGDSVDVLDASGNVMATFGTTARVGAAAGQNIKIDSDSVDVCTGTTVDATISASGASFLQGNANITAFLEGDDFRGINLTASDPSTYLRIVNDLEDGGGVPYSGVMLSKLLAWGPSDSLIWADAGAIVRAANNFMTRTPTAMSNSDLDNMGVGECWWGNNLSNSPDGSTGYFMTFRLGSLQMSYKHLSNGGKIDVWARNYMNSTWGEWTQLNHPTPTTYSESWTATSSSALHTQLTGRLTLAPGTYVISMSLPVVSSTATVRLYDGSHAWNHTVLSGGSSTGKTVVMSFAAQTQVWIASFQSTSITYSNLDRGGLWAVRIA